MLNHDPHRNDRLSTRLLAYAYTVTCSRCGFSTRKEVVGVLDSVIDLVNGSCSKSCPGCRIYSDRIVQVNLAYESPRGS